MPGMGHAPSLTNPTVVSAFQSTLIHQLWIILAVIAAVTLGVNAFRAWQLTRQVRGRQASRAEDAAASALAESRGTAASGAGTEGAGVNAGGAGTGGMAITDSPAAAEPVARRVLRIGFGILWLADGLLQLQSAMPLGLPGNVLDPAASGSPHWVRAIVSDGALIWQRHPVQAAAAAVWIQAGIGLLLIVAGRGRWSRLAGVLSAGWAAAVWTFGEAFGGIFSRGASFLFGVPGAVLFYGIAGLLIALPDRWWSGRRPGRIATAGLGTLFLGMALLQAWPGRGTWVGRDGSRLGAISAMAAQMAKTRQPHVIASMVSAFSGFDAAHGWAVNFAVVLMLAVGGALLLSGRRRLLAAGLVVGLLLCIADWLLIEDMGVFGGTGTDPNSMLPISLLLVAAYLASCRPASPPSPSVAPAPAPASASWHERWSPRVLLQGAFATCAVAVVLVGAVPMAAASVDKNADPIVAEASEGTPNFVNLPAPAFSLIDQRDRPVSLDALRGRTVVLTFLDPVCTTDCPLIAQELRQADAMLGPARRKVEFVAVVANPLYRSVAAMNAFDREEGLASMPNWLYLTGTAAQLRRVWSSYGMQAATEPAGAMVAHTDIAYVIDAGGYERVVLDSEPAPGGVGASSFAVLLSGQIRRLTAA
jgi:cytochrome oxidase Cu insertion factor (SCO1/SenC/PrrC family)